MSKERKTVTGHARKSEAIRQIKANPRAYFSSQERPDRLNRRVLSDSDFGFRPSK